MTIQECYQKIGGDFDEVISRLMTEARVTKFLRRFPGDPSFSGLKTALTTGDKEAAFRMSHTLKGVAQNLGLVSLFDVTDKLTELLRPQTLPLDNPDILSAFQELADIYNGIIETIAVFDA